MLRTAQIELERSRSAVGVERETVGHLNKCHEAINKAVDEVARGNALLGDDSAYLECDLLLLLPLMLLSLLTTDSTNNKVADAYRSAQNFAHEFRNAMREARAINGAVRFAEEILVPRPPVRTSIGGARPPVDSTTDGLVWGEHRLHFPARICKLRGPTATALFRTS